MIKLTNLNQKSALVTGGSSGIGLATACLLASKGANVYILARRKEYLSTALEKIKSAANREEQTFGSIEADVGDENAVNSAIQNLIHTAGVPDLLINSAGVAQPGYVQEIDMKVFRWMMEVNFFGTVQVIKSLLPGMMERGSGYIVNISSMAGYLGVFGYSAYGASKYAIRGFSDVLRAEMKPHGIGVSLVFPPDTETPQLAYEEQFKPDETKALTESGGRMSPEEVARAIVKGIEKGRYLILPGGENKIFYHLNNLLGGTVFSVMDGMISNAQKKKSKTEQAKNK